MTDGLRRGLLGLVLAAASGCSLLASPDPSRFYVLDPLPLASTTTPPRLALGVGPVAFPRYLERPEVVTRVSPTEIRAAVFDLWAASLRSQFEQVLQENLIRLGAAERVMRFPWYPGPVPDVAVEVDVLRFEGDAEQTATLDARWRIRDVRAGRVVREGTSNLSEPANGHGTASGVDALSRALGTMSREIAAALAR
jgi:hypothetical protein